MRCGSAELGGLVAVRRLDQALARGKATVERVAPDFPGFGHSSAPAPADFAYTFDRLAQVMNAFVEELGVARYTLVVQDYGGPVGFRMAMAHPERLQALIIQNAVAHDSGLGLVWQ
ncbi:alpha/beta fold hydrolase, partial [Streptomyces vulcanius]